MVVKLHITQQACWICKCKQVCGLYFSGYLTVIPKYALIYLIERLSLPNKSCVFVENFFSKERFDGFLKERIWKEAL